MVAAQYVQIRAGTFGGFTPVLQSKHLWYWRETGDLHREILFFLAGPLMSDL